jgi:hypothetical protein
LLGQVGKDLVEVLGGSIAIQDLGNDDIIVKSSCANARTSPRNGQQGDAERRAAVAQAPDKRNRQAEAANRVPLPASCVLEVLERKLHLVLQRHTAL